MLKEQSQFLIQLIFSLGFLVNRKKSDLEPSGIFMYLSVSLDLTQGLLLLSQEQLEEALFQLLKEEGGPVAI